MTPITPEQMALYRASAQQREREWHQQLDARFDRAWEVAREAAILLKTEFGVERVVVFGSLADRSLFHVRSDVDLAVWGLAEQGYYRAVGRLQALDTAVSVLAGLLDDKFELMLLGQLLYLAHLCRFQRSIRKVSANTCQP